MHAFFTSRHYKTEVTIFIIIGLLAVVAIFWIDVEKRYPRHSSLQYFELFIKGFTEIEIDSIGDPVSFV